MWSSISFPVFTFKFTDTEISACKHSKVSAPVLYQLVAQSPLFAGWQMSGLLGLKNYYSVILIHRFHSPEKNMGPHHCAWYLLSSYQQPTEAENLRPESQGMTLPFPPISDGEKNDGIQDALLDKLWTFASFRYHNLAPKILIEHQ